jgi:hypothetical protein
MAAATLIGGYPQFRVMHNYRLSERRVYLNSAFGTRTDPQRGRHEIGCCGGYLRDDDLWTASTTASSVVGVGALSDIHFPGLALFCDDASEFGPSESILRRSDPSGRKRLDPTGPIDHADAETSP